MLSNNFILCIQFESNLLSGWHSIIKIMEKAKKLGPITDNLNKSLDKLL